MMLKSYRTVCLIVIAAFSSIGAFMSLGSQRGGMNFINGFLSPLLGPWAKYLKPNSQGIHDWDSGYISFTIIITCLLVALFVSSHLLIKFSLKVIFICVLIIWCLTGMGKVLLELS